MGALTKQQGNYPFDVGTNCDNLSPYRPKRKAVGELVMPSVEDYATIVVFLSVDVDRDGIRRRVPSATGFLVNMPLVDERAAVIYVVTAAHCVEEASSSGKLYVRINRKSGGFVEYPTNPSDWYRHDSADVAIIPFAPNRSEFPDLDFTVLDRSTFVGPGPTYEISVPMGDGRIVTFSPKVPGEIGFLGLFTQHYGKERNLPITRIGRIARMPSMLQLERSDGSHFESVAYLVELHSIGGHSGSPVFFIHPLDMGYYFDIGQELRNAGFNVGEIPALVRVEFGTLISFLGILSGHYDIPQKAKTQGDILGEVQTDLNSGIAFVTPAAALVELLERGDVVKHRDSLQENARKGIPTPTLDSAKLEEVTFTATDFEQALRRVSRRITPSEPGQASSETSD